MKKCKCRKNDNSAQAINANAANEYFWCVSNANAIEMATCLGRSKCK